MRLGGLDEFVGARELHGFPVALLRSCSGGAHRGASL